jgi:hypothetical protein
MTYILQNTSIARHTLAQLRHTTVPSFNGGFIRNYLATEVAALADDLKLAYNKDKLFDRKPFQKGGHSMY